MTENVIIFWDEGRVASAVDEFNGTQGWKIVRVYQHLAILRKQK